MAVTPDRAAGVLRIRAEAATTAQTGVEMEALTAASVAALTIYDMVKGVERGVEIRGVRLLSKSGGTERRLAARPPTARHRPAAGSTQARRTDRRPDRGSGRATGSGKPGSSDRARRRSS